MSRLTKTAGSGQWERGVGTGKMCFFISIFGEPSLIKGCSQRPGRNWRCKPRGTCEEHLQFAEHGGTTRQLGGRGGLCLKGSGQRPENVSHSWRECCIWSICFKGIILPNISWFKCALWKWWSRPIEKSRGVENPQVYRLSSFGMTWI